MTFEEWIKDQPDGYYSNDAIFQAGAASRDAEFARLRAINSKLCEKSNWYVIHTARLEEERDQLRAQINVLREALEKHVTELMNIAVSNGANSVSMPDDYVATALLLSETTEQSLAKYRNKVIEECAVIAENCEPDEHGRLSVQDIAEALRTIKEQP